MLFSRLRSFCPLFLLAAVTLASAAEPPPLAGLLRETIAAKGLEAAQQRFAELKAARFESVTVAENALNSLGYEYLQGRRLPEALAVLRWNTELFPESGNAFDSYGEALVKTGDRDGAIAAYARAVELTPANRNAASVLAELQARPDSVTLMQERMGLEDELNATFEAADAAPPLDGLRAKVRAFLEKYPADSNTGLVRNFLYLSEAAGLASAVNDWKYFAGNSNARIRELGENRRALIEALGQPLELSFTAVDGTPVDVANLRGKVVLVDFWAIWCGPCREEIPNIVATYDKLHSAGFEIVGISLDRAPDPQKPWRSARSAEQLQAFTRENRMPWPQYYDGRHWDNPFAKKYGIGAIPAMFLLDKAGRIVSTNARGPALERKVRELLAQ
jgi:thiol-disulfide isomerase/thioredoxin